MSKTIQCRLCGEWIKPYGLGPHYGAAHPVDDAEAARIVGLAKANLDKGIAWLIEETGRGYIALRNLLVDAGVRMKYMQKGPYKKRAGQKEGEVGTKAHCATPEEHIEGEAEDFVPATQVASTTSSGYTLEQLGDAVVEKLIAMALEIKSLRGDLLAEKDAAKKYMTATEVVLRQKDSEIQQLSKAINELALNKKSWQEKLEVAGVSLGIGR